MGTTVNDLRLKSDDLTATSYPILEPLNAPQFFGNRLDRFGAIYSVSNNSHLYRFLVALCGDNGAGQLKKDLLLPRLEQQLEATHFGNLDRLYGNPLSLPRLSEEIYAYHPETDFLNSSQWDEVLAKDASYRARCLTWMRAIIAGGTVEGLALAAQAATGIEADVWERYEFVQYPGGLNGLDYGRTSGTNEFVVIPRTAFLTQRDRRTLSRLIDILKPVSTIGTVYSGDTTRLQRLANDTAASSTWFNVQRLVTGRADVVWPALDASVGSWIDTTEHEAPTMAFMNSQESATYLTITSSSASSFHVGFFNQPQQALFSHLDGASGDFPPDASYDTSIAPVNISRGWSGALSPTNMVVNKSYPIGYFADIDATDISAPPAGSFWASLEKPALEEDWILFNFGRTRPINYIYFEICQKPLDWTIEYMDADGNFQPVPERADYPATMATAYQPSESNPWTEFNIYFQTVQAQAIRVNFTRRADAFPLAISDPFDFSVELRDVHLIHTIPTADDFVADQGVDVLGNQFRTAIQTYDSDNTVDGSTQPWYSQPNPSKFAVEALYFDLGNQVVDEIYINPITFGCDMHFYYSDDDDETDWDNKLWTPIPQNYVLKRGFHALPRPTNIKFLKIEFSNLTAVPYEPVEFPAPGPITFRRYPIWINSYFTALHPIDVQDALFQVDPLNIDPLTFGFVKIDDRLVSSYEATRVKQTIDTEPEIKTFIDSVVNQSGTITQPQAQIESTIEYHSPMQWQTDLIANLDTTRALSRAALEPHDTATDTGWGSELGLPSIDPPFMASSDDMSVALKEKVFPVMFFSRRCRHQYQIVKAPLDAKIAYIVGVNDVQFYRRNFTKPTDDKLYIETFDDTAHAEIQEFVQSDWRWTVI